MCHVENNNVVNFLYSQACNRAVSHDMLPGKLEPQYQQGALCAFLLRGLLVVIEAVMDNTAPTCLTLSLHHCSCYINGLLCIINKKY